MSSGLDMTMPEGRWTFDESVTDVFDNMLERSIPQIDVMRSTVTELALHHATPGSWIVDLGVSRGGALAPLVFDRTDRNLYLGVDCSDPMICAARDRFDLSPTVDIREHDLRHGYPEVEGDVSVTLSILTLQFVPIEHRQRLVRQAYRATQPGGVLILVEKVLGATCDLDEVMVDTYLSHKRKAGYTDDQIARKRLSLEGVLVPVTARWNEELLTSAGFQSVDCFWRWMNFAGWIAVKDVDA